MYTIIVYNGYKSTFENLLELGNSAPIHHKNIQLLSIELYKVEHNIKTSYVKIV